MSHPLGPPAARTPAPAARRDRLIRLTARRVGRLLRPTRPDPPPPAEVAPAQDRPGWSGS
jgi:hypothetical protein